MKIQFKEQAYQEEAVRAVIDSFEGQTYDAGHSYIIDSGIITDRPLIGEAAGQLDVFVPAYDADDFNDEGLRNAPLSITDDQLLTNLKAIARSKYLQAPDFLKRSLAGPSVPNLDVEMETGTGKTYVYIKTIMELNRVYGWSKFIIVVPSIAIREGVLKTFQMTEDHFKTLYEGKAPKAFIYDSSNLHQIDEFSSNPGVQVMIINIQAFNSTGKDQRRIYEELDEFRSRRPIDVIQANNPIVIVDEPQKISAKKSQESISNLNPLMVLRYSATHKDNHNLVHRLDALDAYTQKLVKKISVCGINVVGAEGLDSYIYLQGFKETQGQAEPIALLQIEAKTASGAVRRKLIQAKAGEDLYDLSGNLEAYNGGYKITTIRRTSEQGVGFIEFTNGKQLYAGDIYGSADVGIKRKLQIQEVVKAHLAREEELYSKGVKVLSLFFIDEVAKYRDYNREDTKGDYARWFEEIYREEVANYQPKLSASEGFLNYLKRFEGAEDSVHAGYFSIDNKSGHAVEGAISRSGDDKGLSKDRDAYDLILKDKERLLSFKEPVRFIFSHSALREGWDNPNVFTLGMLKQSDNTVSRRQEIGRGLRIAVNQLGERMDAPETVHEINQLTVVTDESYTEFVDALQKETAEAIKGRPRKATEEYFTGQILVTADNQQIEITEEMARQIVFDLIRHQYIDSDYLLTDTYLAARDNDTRQSDLNIPELSGRADLVWPVVDALITGGYDVTNTRNQEKLALNKSNFDRAEFQKLWKHINHKATYRVDFESDQLITEAVTRINNTLQVTRLSYSITRAKQTAELAEGQLASGSMFEKPETHQAPSQHVARSKVRYDLIGKIAAETALTRKTVGIILQRINAGKFALYAENPEQFIANAAKLINEAKSLYIVEKVVYDILEDTYETDIFETGTSYNFSEQDKLSKHIYHYLVSDSKVERDFARALEENDEVLVYAKLPGAFKIPTPLGNYNPDWAVVFKEGSYRHLYFVAETKGSTSTLPLSDSEQGKIASAQKFFSQLNDVYPDLKVSYKQVATYQDLINAASNQNETV